jgi:signal transduction histidine kinase
VPASLTPGASRRLSLALRNLLDNAMKYSGDSRAVSVSVARKGRTVAIAVGDRGIGIPHHEQRDIFGTFVRGHGALMHGITGSGLGLAMVRHIVHGHGGRVTVESSPGSGSTFTVVLPAEA